eukprot:CAMPEP_0185793880 /NCGR_PEP_ID=MMETSP1174-20130828/159713_1 /TAXON_ID=35687 /ORGANISM="Dictyocha speculum, Strain CCMP1381" /LENGTH=53 /DNA_ID=CAMNT_0028489069 /DNA_START=1893 /DNA_END=2054 /DNA_ORIENTATION=+
MTTPNSSSWWVSDIPGGHSWGISDEMMALGGFMNQNGAEGTSKAPHKLVLEKG